MTGMGKKGSDLTAFNGSFMFSSATTCYVANLPKLRFELTTLRVSTCGGNGLHFPLSSENWDNVSMCRVWNLRSFEKKTVSTVLKIECINGKQLVAFKKWHINTIWLFFT